MTWLSQISFVLNVCQLIMQLTLLFLLLVPLEMTTLFSNALLTQKTKTYVNNVFRISIFQLTKKNVCPILMVYKTAENTSLFMNVENVKTIAYSLIKFVYLYLKKILFRIVIIIFWIIPVTNVIKGMIYNQGNVKKSTFSIARFLVSIKFVNNVSLAMHFFYQIVKK